MIVSSKCFLLWSRFARHSTKISTWDQILIGISAAFITSVTGELLMSFKLSSEKWHSYGNYLKLFVTHLWSKKILVRSAYCWRFPKIVVTYITWMWKENGIPHFSWLKIVLNTKRYSKLCAIVLNSRQCCSLTNWTVWIKAIFSIPKTFLKRLHGALQQLRKTVMQPCQ